MNSVISAATIEARNSGWDVLGIMDGFEHLIEGRIEEAQPLSITDVSRIHVQGGSILRTSRANPTVRDEGAADPDWRLHACLESLRKLGIDALVTIGGDDTAFSASKTASKREDRRSRSRARTSAMSSGARPPSGSTSSTPATSAIAPSTTSSGWRATSPAP
jgi:6-phosphofructokinase